MTPGDGVALMCPNTVEFVAAYYGIIAAGGVVIPISTLLTTEEIEYVLAESDARLAVTHPGLQQTTRDAAAPVGIPVSVLEAHPSATPLASHVTRKPDDVAVQFYTSGTTGKPKGALLTHLNLVMCATVNAFDANPFHHDDIVLGCLPLFHTFGQSVAMNSTFRIGATLVLQERFDAAAAIDLMVGEAVTMFFGVPTMFFRLANAAEDAAEVPRLRACVSGGASLPVPVLESFERAFSTTVHEGVWALGNLADSRGEPGRVRHEGGNRGARRVGSSSRDRRPGRGRDQAARRRRAR